MTSEHPVPGPGQLLVRVHAAAVNFPDVLFIAGKYQTKPPFPFSPAAEVAGVIESVGPGVTELKVGDRVIAYLDHVGRVEGRITRIIDNGFAMTIGATAHKRDKLAAQLTWLANRDLLNLQDRSCILHAP